MPSDFLAKLFFQILSGAGLTSCIFEKKRSPGLSEKITSPKSYRAQVSPPLFRKKRQVPERAKKSQVQNPIGRRSHLPFFEKNHKSRIERKKLKFWKKLKSQNPIGRRSRTVVKIRFRDFELSFRFRRFAATLEKIIFFCLPTLRIISTKSGSLFKRRTRRSHLPFLGSKLSYSSKDMVSLIRKGSHRLMLATATGRGKFCLKSCEGGVKQNEKGKELN